MKIKSKVKQIPVTEVKLELTEDDIEAIHRMDITLDVTDVSPYEDYVYDISANIHTDKQIKLVKKFLKALRELNNEI